MSAQGTRFAKKFEVCGGTAQGWFGQFIDHGKLRWAEDWHCEACGLVSDDGGIGPTPDGVRRPILAEHGACALWVGAFPGAKTQTLKVFREVFGVDLDAALDMAAQAMSSGWFGTRVEVEMMSIILKQKGVHVTVSPPVSTVGRGTCQG